MTNVGSADPADARPLSARHDWVLLDLDGVVYRGGAAVPGAAEAIAALRAAGCGIAYVTNNASRPPDEVAERLTRLGVPADRADVVTSAQAAAHVLADRLAPGAAVLVVGGPGLQAALSERGLRPVTHRSDRPEAVVSGFDPGIGWRQLAEAAYALAAGIPWVATNLDPTIPTADGIAPGNGSLVDAVAAAVGRRPDLVAGKPHRPLFDETLARIRAADPLVVGDRLDTDIEGAAGCGLPSLLVMTGVTSIAEVCAADGPLRPTHVAWSLSGLLRPRPPVVRTDDRWQIGGWTLRADGGQLRAEAQGDHVDDGLRTVVAAAWAARDERGTPIDVGRVAAALEAASCQTGDAEPAEGPGPGDRERA